MHVSVCVTSRVYLCTLMYNHVLVLTYTDRCAPTYVGAHCYFDNASKSEILLHLLQTRFILVILQDHFLLTQDGNVPRMRLTTPNLETNLPIKRASAI